MKKPPKCPKCKQNYQVIPVLIGMPTSEGFEKAERGELHIHGCITVGGGIDPEWFCKGCEYEFNNHMDWLRMEELVEEHNKQYLDKPVNAEAFMLDYGIRHIIEIFENRKGKRVETSFEHPDGIIALDYFNWKYVEE